MLVNEGPGVPITSKFNDKWQTRYALHKQEIQESSEDKGMKLGLAQVCLGISMASELALQSPTGRPGTDPETLQSPNYKEAQVDINTILRYT